MSGYPGSITNTFPNIGPKVTDYVINGFASVYPQNLPTRLFDSTQTDFALYNSTDYVDITINKPCNIYATSGYMGSKVSVLKWNGSAFADMGTDLLACDANTSVWTKVYSNLQPGRYKFLSNHGANYYYEWYLERIPTYAESHIKTKIEDMDVGDSIPCRYTALTSGSVGTFSELGICTASEIPIAGTDTPDGLFYFIMAGYDSQGIKKLVADRNIQTSIPWNILNNAGISSGIPLWTDNKSLAFTMRLLTGGVSSTDKDNEWDKIIGESTLEGNITAGDDNVWHWSNIISNILFGSVTSTTNPTNNTYRVNRGGYGIASRTDSGTGTIYSTVGFRPILLVESLYTTTTKYLIQWGSHIYDLHSTIPNTLAELPVAKTLSEGQSILEALTAQDIESYGCTDINVVLQAKKLFPLGSKYGILRFKSN